MLDKLALDCHAHFELYSKSKIEEEIELAKKCVEVVFDSITEYRKAHVWKSWEILKPYFGYIIPTIGFHPNEAKRGNWDRVKKVEDFLREKHKEIVAVGEIGLDFYHAKTEVERENQMKILRHFLKISSELNLPVVIHARKAEELAFKEVDKFDVKAYFHSFTGDVNLAKEIEFIGISTGIRFIPEVREVAKKVDLENILIETDSPYMSPFKGKVNNPCNVFVVLEDLEKLKGVEVEEIIEVVRKNTSKFFGINL